MNSLNVYKKNNVKIASPLQHVIALYEKAARHMEEALKAMNEGRIEDRFCETERARQILLGLRSVLQKDTPEQQEVSKNLEDYYAGIGILILQTNETNDKISCQNAVQSLKEMAACWKEVENGQLAAG